jgi:hypothetical protein
MSSLMSGPRDWNRAAMRRIAALEPRAPSRTWPLLGMLALGLVAGAALGGYAVSQRSQIKRLVVYTRRMRDDFAGNGESADQTVAVGNPRRSNHRRKATAEV